MHPVGLDIYSKRISICVLTSAGKAREAALMMKANNSLSHSPPTSWTCYSANGSDAAGRSNIAFGYSTASVISQGYMQDSGSNNTEVGHRRWILHPFTEKMGIGSTDNTNANWVIGSTVTKPTPTWVSWPPAGATRHGESAVVAVT